MRDTPPLSSPRRLDLQGRVGSGRGGLCLLGACGTRARIERRGDARAAEPASPAASLPPPESIAGAPRPDRGAARVSRGASRVCGRGVAARPRPWGGGPRFAEPGGGTMRRRRGGLLAGTPALGPTQATARGHTGPWQEATRARKRSTRLPRGEVPAKGRGIPAGLCPAMDSGGGPASRVILWQCAQLATVCAGVLPVHRDARRG